MHPSAEGSPLAARLSSLEREVARLQRTAFGLLAVLLALVTCGSGDTYSTSNTTEHLGWLAVREVRVGSEQAAIHLVGDELRVQRKDGGWTTLTADGLRIHAADGRQLAAYTADGQREPVAPKP